MSVSAIRANRKREHFFDHPPGQELAPVPARMRSMDEYDNGGGERQMITPFLQWRYIGDRRHPYVRQRGQPGHQRKRGAGSREGPQTAVLFRISLILDCHVCDTVRIGLFIDPINSFPNTSVLKWYIASSA
jgi:hypothetical protein